MANSERTFADRAARGRDLHAAIAEFEPVFEPADAALEPATYEAFLDDLDELNTDVNTADVAVSTAIQLHKTLLRTIKQRTTQVVAHIRSVTAWKQYLPAVKQAADKVRGYRPRSKPAPPPAPGDPPEPKPRKVGQQSYGDIDNLFEKVIKAVKLVPGYAPPATSNIQTAQLETLQGTSRGANTDLATKDAILSRAQSLRLAAYDGETGLREKMKAIKEATKSQYGQNSDEYLSVKGIRV